MPAAEAREALRQRDERAFRNAEHTAITEQRQELRQMDVTVRKSADESLGASFIEVVEPHQLVLLSSALRWRLVAQFLPLTGPSTSNVLSNQLKQMQGTSTRQVALPPTRWAPLGAALR